MKIYIGPYKNWIGPYQLADLLQIIGVSEDRCRKIGEWLSNTKLNDLCQWIDSKRKRKINVKIHKYDSWNADSTLAIIILPVLKQLKEVKHGTPLVKDEDVPSYLKSTNAPKVDDYETDLHFFQRWNWVMNEMIWAFEQLQPDNDWEDQYRSGDIDMDWKKTSDGFSEIVYGPNHTLKIDMEGLDKHSDRIDNGLRLFGVYYRGLWD